MSVNKVFSFVALAFFFLIFSTAVPVGTVADTTESHDDKLFLQQAANSVSWMITLGELARKQAASSDIGKYGVQMADDYRKHLDALNLLARQKGLSLAPDNNATRLNTTQSFSQKFGAEFDRDYISLMEDENNFLVIRYRQEAQKGLDAEIRAFASEKIKILEGYVAWAHKILLDLPKPVLK
jgi:putative membrane protein